MQCNLLTQDGCYGFKMAFDETYGRFPPGVLLGIEHIRIMHRNDLILWMDSCAAPGQIMLWPDKKLIRTILLSTNPFPGDMIVGLIHVLKKMKIMVLAGFNNLKGESHSSPSAHKKQS